MRYGCKNRCLQGHAKLSVFSPRFVVNSTAMRNEESNELVAAEDIAAADVPHAHEGPPMTELERIRHSCAHVLATAILRIWPEAQFAAGPPVQDGFYYDVELAHRISPNDFEKIEAEMKKEIKGNHPFQRSVVSRDEALQLGRHGRLAALAARDQ